VNIAADKGVRVAIALAAGAAESAMVTFAFEGVANRAPPARLTDDCENFVRNLGNESWLPPQRRSFASARRKLQSAKRGREIANGTKPTH